MLVRNLVFRKQKERVGNLQRVLGHVSAVLLSHHLALSQSNTLSCRDIDARSARYDPADSLVPEHERLKKVLRARAVLGASPALAADELLLKKDLG